MHKGSPSVSCSGKVAFVNFVLADRAAKARSRAKVEIARVAYYCAHCRRWHLGS